MPSGLVSGISSGFPELSQSQGQVAHVLLTRSPLIPQPKPGSPFDLHVLSTPPAFVLSQDQTLREILEEFLLTAPSDRGPRMRQRNPRESTSELAETLGGFTYFGIDCGTLLSSQGAGAHL